MKILTKLMLASAVMVTSGFALPDEPVIDPDPVIDGTIEMKSGAEWETTKDHTITSTGAITLEKADVEGEGARWIISEGNTINVQGGTIMVTGEDEDEYGPTINLDGTLKLTKSGENYPVVKLDGANVMGSIKYVCDDTEVSLGDEEELVTGEVVRRFSCNSLPFGYFVNDGKIGVILNNDSVQDKEFTTQGEAAIGGWLHRLPTAPSMNNRYGKFAVTTVCGVLNNGDTLEINLNLTGTTNYGDTVEDTISIYYGDFKSDINETTWLYLDDVVDGEWQVDITAKVSLDEVEGAKTVSGYFSCVAIPDFMSLSRELNGTLDASPLREYVEGETSSVDLKGKYSGFAPKRLRCVKKPYNCYFGDEENPGVDLTNVELVEFTTLTKGATYETEVTDDIIGMKKIEGGTYGDYRDPKYGVILPTEASKLKITENKIADGPNTFDLKTIAEDGSYNISDYKINTTYLSENTHELAGNFIYNVGFTGAGNPIKISGTDVVATFKGDASGYTPTGDITLTDKVTYAGNNSFIKKSYVYDELVFAAAASEDSADALVNEIPEGVEVSAKKFSVGKGHKVTVFGKVRA